MTLLDSLLARTFLLSCGTAMTLLDSLLARTFLLSCGTAMAGFGAICT